MSEKGLTVVEVGICLVVMCVLAIIAYPIAGNWKSKFILHSETVNLVSELHRARFAAITRNEYVVLVYHENGYKVFVDDGSGGGIKDDKIHQPGEKVLSEVVFDEQVKIDIDESSFSLNRTMFSGKVGVKAGTFVLIGADGNKSRIIMNTIGRVRVEKA